MTAHRRTNLPASVRRRLLNKARIEKRAFQELATLFAMERFLFRLSASPHADTFILKGGLMTLTWAGEHARVTRDIDLLGRGSNSVEAVVAHMRDVVTVGGNDGITFDASSLKGTKITAETDYVGVRVTLSADLAGMLIRLQVDVGFGDAVVPEPQWLNYPQILDFGTPRLLGYPAEATLAEKLHAIVVRGLTNSRAKDYYDLWTAHQLGITTAEGLGEALKHTAPPAQVDCVFEAPARTLAVVVVSNWPASPSPSDDTESTTWSHDPAINLNRRHCTFERRRTTLPTELPEGLTSVFAKDSSKRAQWAGFVRKSGLDAPSLEEVVVVVADLAWPAFEVALQNPS